MKAHAGTFQLRNEGSNVGFVSRFNCVGDLVNCDKINILGTITVDSSSVTVETFPTDLEAGSIIFSNGSNLSEDNANLFYDETNNRVGIGTITPSTTLHVVGSATITGDIKIPSDSKKQFFGVGSDVSITFNGTDMVINSENVTAGDDLKITNFTSVDIASPLTATKLVIDNITIDGANIISNGATIFLEPDQGGGVVIIDGSLSANSGDFGQFVDVDDWKIIPTVVGSLLAFENEPEVPAIIGVFERASEDCCAADTGFRAYGVGAIASLTNTEYLEMLWDDSDTQFEIGTVATGTGTVRPLEIKTGTNTGQILLNTDGSVSMNDVLTVSKTVDATTSIMDFLVVNVTTQTGITASTTILLTSSYIEVESDSGDVTVTANPRIEDGAGGQWLILQGTSDTERLIFGNGNGLLMSASVTLGDGDVLAFVFNATKDVWVMQYSDTK